MSVVERKHEAESAVESRAADRDGAGRIPVENPATAETIAHVPDLGAEAVADLVDRARRAQPAWEALGFEGRAEVMYEARAWIVENRDRMLRTIMEETGKTREDAIVGDWSFICDSLGFWAKRGPKYLADERIRPHSPFLIGKRVVVRHRPRRGGRGHRAVELPAQPLLRRRDPGADGGQRRGAQAERGHPAVHAVHGRGDAGGGPPRGRDAGGHRSRRDGRRPGGPLRHDHVHRLHRDRPQDHGPRRGDAHARVARARRQGPDDRAARRRRRARGEHGCDGGDVERRPDLHLGRAGLRRGAGLRRLRAAGGGEDERAPPGAAGGGRLGRRGRGHVPAPGRGRRGARARRRRQGGAGTRGRRARRGTWPLLPADRPHRRRPLDEGDDRGDLRPDAADHEGARRGGGPSPRQRHAVRAQLERVDARSRARRSGRAPDRGRQRVRERRARELPRPGGPVRRRQELGRRGTALRAGDPQVHQRANDPDHALRSQARDLLLPVLEARHGRHGAAHRVAVRAASPQAQS